MKYSVYVLYSEKYKKHYTGFTSNLENRVLSHNELGKDWTAKYRPWKLVFTKDFDSKKRRYRLRKMVENWSWQRFYKNIKTLALD